MKVLESNLLISGINIRVVRKNVKNINFSVRAIDGCVRVSVPRNLSNQELQDAISSKINWIRSKIQVFEARPKKLTHTYRSGDKINYLDREYTLKVIEHAGSPRIVEQESNILEMRVRDNTMATEKESLLYEWYRCKLKLKIPTLIKKWQSAIGVEATDWGIKKMKTRWGTCNPLKKRIWLNLELARHSEACLEYVVVHEMTHLLERNHNARFKRLLDEFIPGWREIENELNSRI